MLTLGHLLVTALLTYTAHSFATCTLALSVSRFLYRPQDRDLLWKATLVAPLLTAVAAVLLSTLGGHGMFVDLSHLARQLSPGELPGRQLEVRVFHRGDRSNVVRELTDPVTSTLSAIAVCLAVTASIVALTRFAHRRGRLSRAIANRWDVAEVLSGRGTRIRVSAVAELQSPVALGSGEICLPAEVVNEFPEPHQRSLIAHEAAHLTRRDPAWFLATDLIGALSAFQPLIFPVIRAFRRDVELVCDEAAVRTTNDRASLIGALALLASPLDPRSPLHGAATAYDGSPLVRRAERISTVSLGAQDVGARRKTVLAIAGCIALLCATLVVSASPRRTDLPLDPSTAFHDMRDSSKRIIGFKKVVTTIGRRTIVVAQ